MASTEFTNGSVICRKGEPFRHIIILMKGSAETSLGGHVFKFGQGDMLGLNAINEGVHSLTYTASSDSTVFTYPYDDPSTIQALFREKPDIANVVVNSMCRQITMFLQYYSHLKNDALAAYELVTQSYPEYGRLCGLYAYTPKKLPMLATVTSPTDGDGVDEWVNDYYMGIKESDPSLIKSFFSKLGISFGFVLGGAKEISGIVSSCIHYQKYLAEISKVMLSPAGFDLFSVIADLHIESASIPGANQAVEKIMSPLVSMLSRLSYVDNGFFQKRLAAYRDGLQSGGGDIKPVVTAGEKQNLADSMSVILAYSGSTPEQINKFTRLVQDYTKLNDRSSSDEEPHKMRRELTNLFNDIYKRVFLRSLSDHALPTIIKMFLNFGYMDAALAGHENADYMYSIADSLCGDPSRGVYTAREWLTAIYEGKKDPCRNEFDMDYAAYVADLKQQKRFDANEEARLLADKEKRLLFEIEQIFPIVNKLTFGRITTFCPIFSDNNVQRSLESSIVTPDAIREAFAEITSVDFSAFYRETLYSNPEIGVQRENVNVEIMPEVILMPNVGARGIMWQEIEGRKRTTPSRMFVPLFLLTDLKPLLVRLTGEFRWEICKRIQGTRWQDITEPSLTSEYCDYLQFYRTNRDLSPEVKVSVKAELSRARNNYKSVFVSNYVEWLTYEANGSPRLNRHARRLMMTYCAFAAKIRESLAQNPQYADPLKRLNFKLQQREQFLSRLIQKITQSGTNPPKELLDELSYVKS